MNGFLRYAHNLTPYRIFLAFLRWKCTVGEPAAEWTEAWNNALAAVPEETTRTTLQKFHSKAATLVLSQLILSPGLLILLAPALIITAILYSGWTNVRDIYRSFSDRFPMSFLEEEAAKS